MSESPLEQCSPSQPKGFVGAHPLMLNSQNIIHFKYKWISLVIYVSYCHVAVF